MFCDPCSQELQVRKPAVAGFIVDVDERRMLGKALLGRKNGAHVSSFNVTNQHGDLIAASQGRKSSCHTKTVCKFL